MNCLSLTVLKAARYFLLVFLTAYTNPTIRQDKVGIFNLLLRQVQRPTLLAAVSILNHALIVLLSPCQLSSMVSSPQLAWDLGFSRSRQYGHNAHNSCIPLTDFPALMMLRTYALWGRSKKILISLSVLLVVRDSSSQLSRHSNLKI